MSANRGWLPELGVVEVATPCRADWDQMAGDAKVRACAACKLNVYDLSELTADEARILLSTTEDRRCVRFWVRADGRVLTRDCPVGIAARARRRFAAVVASIVALVSVGRLFGSEGTADGPPTPLPIPQLMGPAAPADGPVVGLDWADQRRKLLGADRGSPVQGRTHMIGIIRTSQVK